MRDFLTMLLQWWAFFFGGIVAVGVCIYIVHKAIGKLKKLFRRLAIVVVAFVAVIYGGTKNLKPKFTTDDGLTVVEATMARATNETDYTSLAVKWMGPDADKPIWVRESVSERWQGFPLEDWNYVGRTYEGGTNIVEYFINPGVAASNATVWAHWHLGSDLPPVEVDGEGVTIEQFAATSQHVTIRYAVNPAALTGPGAVSIEAQRTDSIWFEVYRLAITQPVTNTVSFPGFWVGETTRWRVRLEVGE